MIPTVADVASDPLTHLYLDTFQPPGLANALGSIAIDKDLTAIRARSFPPVANGDVLTGVLFLNGCYFPALGAPVTFQWRPDRVVRTAVHDGLSLTSTTVLGVRTTGGLVRLEVTNLGDAERDVSVRFTISAGVTRSVSTWNTPMAPWGFDNDAVVDVDRDAVVFRSRETGATNVQGCVPRADVIDQHGIEVARPLAAGETLTVTLIDAMGDDAADALAVYDRLAADVPATIAAAEVDWNAELAAVFTPGNDRYSGHLPTLHTTDEDIRRLYFNGVLGVITFKRETPHSVLGRTYDTLMPRFWPTLTFLWDFSLSGVVHALLDPGQMRRHLEHWIKSDIHTFMATEWLTGAGLGAWYSVNDFAMTRMIRDHLRYGGDLDWLDEKLPGPDGVEKPVAEFLVDYADSWRNFRRDSGLADYGGIDNLLECVSSYVHEVASLNSANVFCLRTAAEVLELRGEHDRASRLREDAHVLLIGMLELYVEGEGHWYARHPDGTRVQVRHIYDLLTVLYTIGDDLDEQMLSQMQTFFAEELQTDLWARALSPKDPDAIYSVRADHQWNGAYTAWPSETATGLLRHGRVEETVAWIKGLAKSANQGPFGQAHFAEGAVAPDNGGARKVPPEMPFINDWACSSGGSWAAMVIEGLFGVKAGLDGIEASPNVDAFDPDARLTGLTWQGRTFDVDRTGLTEIT